MNTHVHEELRQGEEEWREKRRGGRRGGEGEEEGREKRRGVREGGGGLTERKRVHHSGRERRESATLGLLCPSSSLSLSCSFFTLRCIIAAMATTIDKQQQVNQTPTHHLRSLYIKILTQCSIVTSFKIFPFFPIFTLF